MWRSRQRPRVLLAITVTAVALVAVGSTAGPAAGKPPKVDVCHAVVGSGSFELLSVPEGSVQGHLDHGDFLPADGDESCGSETLGTVQTRGVLRCGVGASIPGFSIVVENERVGMDADLCRAIATAVLGEGSAVEFVELAISERFQALRDGAVDVVLQIATNTLRRDASEGVDFGPTYYHDGQGFLVWADSGITTVTDLAGMTVCVTADATMDLTVKAAEVGFDVLQVQDGLAAVLSGDCQAFSSHVRLAAALAVASGYEDDFRVLPEQISKDPLAPVVRDGDGEWAEVVRWVVNATLWAEELDLTSATIDDRRGEPLVAQAFGTGQPAETLAAALALDRDWAYRVVHDVGSYAEIYDRNLGPGNGTTLPIPRVGSYNASYVDGGLLYSPPLN